MFFTLCLTHDCNLRCSYCYAGRKSHRVMTWETARRAIDFAVGYQREHDPVHPFTLSFFGGEPLLEWDLLTEADAYAARRCTEAGLLLKRTVTSNLTLLTPEKVAWLHERRYHLGLSLDGTRTMHEAFRPYADGRSSYDDCLKGVALLREYVPRPEFICVVNPETLPLLLDGIRALADLAPFRITLNTNFSACWDDASLQTLAIVYRAIADDYVAAWRIGRPIHVTWIESKIKTLLYDGFHDCDRCAPLSKELAVSPAGHFYPCCNLVGEDDRADLRFGNVETGLDAAAYLRALGRCGNKEPVCRDCPIASRCANWCTCVNYFSTGHADRVGPVTCFLEKLSIELADQVADTLSSEKNAGFLSLVASWLRRDTSPSQA